MIRASLFPTFFIALTYVLLSAAPVPAQSPPAYHRSFQGAEKWAQKFDDPNRDEWQKPHEVIQALALKLDAVIADIGSGTGYFSVRLAHMVPKGRVYGVDTEPDMVKYLAERAKREGLTNLIAVKGAPGDPRLPGKVDLVIMVDVIHHIDDRDSYFRKLRDFLKRGGRIAIIDYRMDSPDGPPKSARITPDELKAELNGAGYVLVREHAFLPYQYFLIFRPRRLEHHKG
jgi:SAM-dependent methyltransferase